MGMDFQKGFFKNIDKKKFVQIPWPVDQDRFIKSGNLSKKPGPVKLLMVARFLPYKDHNTLINALEILKNKNIPFELSLVGSGQTKEAIKSRIEYLDLKGQIDIFDKYLSENELHDQYSKSDILLLASKYESYGMVVPEAMAHGCAIIVSDTVGAKFMVKNGINGYVFKTGSAKDLAEKIILASKNLKALQRNSMEIMKNEFSDRKIIQDYEKLVSEIIHK
jgi:glycosyltransferase involved in cell wall biosynthesis